jgi:GAF domain-containing protein
MERDPVATLASVNRTRRILESRNWVLERIAQGAPLGEVLLTLTRTSEEIFPGMKCSVLLVDADRRRLRQGAAPSLPESYCRAIDGVEIGPSRGSCGTAAFTGRRVIVEDVLTHPYWKGYTHLAVAAGLRACWSEPILSGAGIVLGTFAMYYAEPRAPEPHELDFIRGSAHIAAVAIEQARGDGSLARELDQVHGELASALAEAKALRAQIRADGD